MYEISPRLAGAASTARGGGGGGWGRVVGSGRDMAHDTSLMSSGPTIQSF